MKVLFPSILMALQVGAAVVYFDQSDRSRAAYWLCGAALTWIITFGRFAK